MPLSNWSQGEIPLVAHVELPFVRRERDPKSSLPVVLSLHHSLTVSCPRDLTTDHPPYSIATNQQRRIF